MEATAKRSISEPVPEVRLMQGMGAAFSEVNWKRWRGEGAAVLLGVLNERGNEHCGVLREAASDAADEEGVVLREGALQPWGFFAESKESHR
jgi:hypothetical protein